MIDDLLILGWICFMSLIILMIMGRDEFIERTNDSLGYKRCRDCAKHIESNDDANVCTKCGGRNLRLR